MYFIRHAWFCLALVISFALVSSQAQGDLLYTITGFANNIGDPNDPLLAPEVSAGESYVAEFLIDEFTPDSNPDPTAGVFAGAIVSSSITFSGGYSSLIDFAGGEITVAQDIGGGAIFFSDPNDLSTLLIGDLGNPFPSDGLLDAGTQIIGSPISLWSLEEPTGLIVSASQPNPGPNTGPIVLTVTSAIPEPSTACLLAFGAIGSIVRRRR